MANYCYALSMGPWSPLAPFLVATKWAAALIIFDITITLSREIERVWQRKITGATVLFVVVRYGRVINFALWSIYLYTWVRESEEQADFVGTF